MKYSIHVAVHRESNLVTPLVQSSMLNVLTEAELVQFQKRTRPEKQSEFLRSRFLAKKLGVDAGLAVSPNQLQVTSSPDGRPTLVDISRQVTYLISISHSFPSVAVAISPQLDIGIDTERIPAHENERTRNRWRDSLLNVAFREEESLRIRESEDSQSELVLRWTIKESVAKAANRVGLANLATIDTSHFPHDRRPDQANLLVNCINVDEMTFRVISRRTGNDEWTSVATTSVGSNESSYYWNRELLSVANL